MIVECLFNIRFKFCCGYLWRKEESKMICRIKGLLLLLTINIYKICGKNMVGWLKYGLIKLKIVVFN